MLLEVKFKGLICMATMIMKVRKDLKLLFIGFQSHGIIAILFN